MTSVLSATEHDHYSFPLPIVVWCWLKAGFKSLVFIPENAGPKLKLAQQYCPSPAYFETFTCEERKEATYAQTSRLFGAAVGYPDDEMLITGDADLAVFGNVFKNMDDGEIHIIGADLLEDSMQQFPMCFIAMPAKKWRTIFDLYGTAQEALDNTVGKLESQHFRGDHWGYDQWYAYKRITESGFDTVRHNRAKMPERFAKHRADRDNAYWLEHLTPKTIDAHLWRPLWEEANFQKLMTIMKFFWPDEDFTWIVEYREKYIELL